MRKPGRKRGCLLIILVIVIAIVVLASRLLKTPGDETPSGIR